MIGMSDVILGALTAVIVFGLGFICGMTWAGK